MAQKRTADQIYDRLQAEGTLDPDVLSSLFPPGTEVPENAVRTEAELAAAIAHAVEGELADLRTLSPSEDVKGLIPDRVVQSTRILPLQLVDGELSVAYYDPWDLRGLDRVRRASRGQQIRPLIAPRGQLLRLFERQFGSSEEAAIDEFIKRSQSEVGAMSSVDRSRSLFTLDFEEDLGETTVERLLDAIVIHAVKRRATDIHVTCHPGHVALQHRVDGVLGPPKIVPKDLRAALISRIKLSGGMDISRSGLPQDGNFQVEVEGKSIQIRVGVFPTVYGEDIALRLLYSDIYLLELTQLGFSEANLPVFSNMLDSTKGMILVTGPVGVGKTTTLYSSLSRLSRRRGRIITLEDPVESRIEGITQSQISPETGYDFAAGLRSILRMDPDVIMVGEIRDVETAQMALRASLTGMLVLSTLHTDRAAGAIARLLDMEAEPFLLTSSLLGVLAQALVRRICDECKEPVTIDPAVVESRNLPRAILDGPAWHGAGCDHCEQTGYFGRTGLYELLVVDNAIRDKIKQRADTPEIAQAAQDAGMDTLFDDGIGKLHRGLTTVDELIRVLSGRG